MFSAVRPQSKGRGNLINLLQKVYLLAQMPECQNISHPGGGRLKLKYKN